MLQKENMNTKHVRREIIRNAVSQRHAIVLSLQSYRRLWQEAAADRSLVDITVPIGLVLADIAAGLGLDRRERLLALGANLVSAISAYLEESIQAK